MAGLVGEPHDLVLNRRAVAGAAPRQTPAIDCALAQVLGDEAVCLFGRVGDAAGDLGNGDPIRQKGEGAGGLVGLPGDGPPIQSRWRAGLQPAHGQAGGVQINGQTRRRRLAVPACRNTLLAPMNDAVQEGAGRQDDSSGSNPLPCPGNDARDAVAVQDQPLRRAGHQRQVRRLGQLRLHGFPIQASVDLAAWSPNGGALGPVQQSELDARGVRQTAHDPVHGVDLTHEMPLAQAADSGVAGHFADGLQLLGQKQGSGPRARRGGGGFTAGVAAADDDDDERMVACGDHARHIGQNSRFRQRRERATVTTGFAERSPT